MSSIHSSCRIWPNCSFSLCTHTAAQQSASHDCGHCITRAEPYFCNIQYALRMYGIALRMLVVEQNKQQTQQQRIHKLQPEVYWSALLCNVQQTST
jgi:hypothetical protein